MNNICIFLLVVVQVLFVGQNAEQSTESTPGSEFIVEVADAHHASLLSTLADIPYSLKRIHPSSDVYRLHVSGEFDPMVLTKLKENRIIRSWQHDQPVKQRNTPNDPFYSEQWDMMRIGMAEVWDRTTGGVTVNDDTIVIAILDTGFQTDHEDLRNNVWRNRAEIPNDNLDNDLNGYVDDYIGLNIQTGDDVHDVEQHGTAVAGIIGAEGNNGKGIAGVNWHVKLLLISGIDKESDIIEGYMYIRALRQKYNTSGGSQGAFVVATNLSAGIDNALPVDHAMWCAQYESLGNVGILGICATTNTNSDVDMFGDMPTTCPSEFLVAVTNTGMDDQKLMFAGFGKTHVDLGAPGTPTKAPDLGHGYKDFIGTSAATPHVAGAVGILYAMACDEIVGLATTQPATVARQMKSIILEQTDAIPGLLPLTVSGGRLNIRNAVNAIDALCGNTGGEVMVIQITPNPVVDAAVAEYRLPSITPHEVLIYDAAGRLVLRESPKISGPGLQQYSINSGRMVPGVYHFTVRQDGVQETLSFLVQ